MKIINKNLILVILFFVFGNIFFVSNSHAAETYYCSCASNDPSLISCDSVVDTDEVGMAMLCKEHCDGGLCGSYTIESDCSASVVKAKKEAEKKILLAERRYCCYQDSDPAKRISGKTTGCLEIGEEGFKATKDGYGSGCVSYTNEDECEISLLLWEIREDLDGKKATQSSFIPDCALYDDLTGACRDVSIFVTMLINIGRYLFAMVGSLVILMFVLGGFQLIISQGSAEKVKKARDIMVGAVIGLTIVFGAYMLVDFLGDTLKVQTGIDINTGTGQEK